MDVDPPDRQNPCDRRLDLMTSIESEEILISNFSDIINVPDTDQNIRMKEIVKKQIKEHQQDKVAALAELDSLPPCIKPKCSKCSIFQMHSNSSSPMPEEPKTIVENPPINNDNKESAEVNPLPKRKPKKKRKKTKDVTDDFVFPKKTARPVSPIATELIATSNSFSDLESDVEEEKQMEQTPQELPAPKPISPIYLKIKTTVRDQLKAIYSKFPETINKLAGEFLKLTASNSEEYHSLTQLLEQDSDYESIVVKPKTQKPIKVGGSRVFPYSQKPPRDPRGSRGSRIHH
ncbi:uncharacterized protein TNCT_565081 [Trichonephila clavata]|uniref:Uncharacterized protein n=1 Tax=Trichonephila clavata TaxID=2740835 RepID=A0A8X6LK02_TRICU|nr:uncharacterized protein TNCT_565081 [Trichonephila clavata]